MFKGIREKLEAAGLVLLAFAFVLVLVSHAFTLNF